MTTIFFTALDAEAAPLISHWQLKRTSHHHSLACFEGDELTVVVTRVGKVAAAYSVGTILAGHDISDSWAINVGVAGAPPDFQGTKGDLFLIHKITDEGTERVCYPDLLLPWEGVESSLITVDRPVLSASDGKTYPGLVDMEASGFYQAAAMRLPPHRISVLKVISDFLGEPFPSRQQVTSLIESQISTIETFLDTARRFSEQQKRLLHPGDDAWLNEIESRLQLTVSQKHQVTTWLRAYRRAGLDTLPEVGPLLQEIPKDKSAAKARLLTLKKLLHA